MTDQIRMLKIQIHNTDHLFVVCAPLCCTWASQQSITGYSAIVFHKALDVAKKAKLTILQNFVLIIFLFAWSMKQHEAIF